jgi:predicted permease
VPEDTAGLLSGSSIAVAAATAIGLGAYIGRKKQYKRALVILLLAGLAAIVVWSLIHHHVLGLPSDSTQKISLLTALSVAIAVGFYRYRPLRIFTSNAMF